MVNFNGLNSPYGYMGRIEQKIGSHGPDISPYRFNVENSDLGAKIFAGGTFAALATAAIVLSKGKLNPAKIKNLEKGEQTIIRGLEDELASVVPNAERTVENAVPTTEKKPGLFKRVGKRISKLWNGTREEINLTPGNTSNPFATVAPNAERTVENAAPTPEKKPGLFKRVGKRISKLWNGSREEIKPAEAQVKSYKKYENFTKKEVKARAEKINKAKENRLAQEAKAKAIQEAKAKAAQETQAKFNEMNLIPATPLLPERTRSISAEEYSRNILNFLKLNNPKSGQTPPPLLLLPERTATALSEEANILAKQSERIEKSNLVNINKNPQISREGNPINLSVESFSNTIPPNRLLPERTATALSEEVNILAKQSERIEKSNLANINKNPQISSEGNPIITPEGLNPFKTQEIDEAWNSLHLTPIDRKYNIDKLYRKREKIGAKEAYAKKQAEMKQGFEEIERQNRLPKNDFELNDDVVSWLTTRHS